MLLFHPEHAALSCRECQRFIYDVKTAKPVLRGGQKQPRHVPPPCYSCPKKSPAEESRITLSPWNRRTLELYFQNRAMGGCLLESQKTDATLRRNFAIIDQLYTHWHASKSADSMGRVLAQVLPLRGLPNG